ncbi:hypothetical protein [uncultured Kordia sp.]|uniref:hypothetical protein n=1 Tax=uncultured Kordia sp. TaxID=507699 RepID=UPI00263459FF|nr:hypothetical protein [uncultured Kordia sp.]
MKKRGLKSLKLNKTSISELKGGNDVFITGTIIITRNSCAFSCTGSCNSCNSCDGCLTFDTSILINPPVSI